MDFPILSSLILLPTIGALFLFFTKDKEENNLTAKYVALFVTTVNFFISIYLWFYFDQSTSNFQFIEKPYRNYSQNCYITYGTELTGFFLGKIIITAL